MTMSRILNLQCKPPFLVSYNYEVKDWLTNDLNLRDSEANQYSNDSFVKVPVNEKIPMSINLTSLSEKPMTIKSIDIDVLNTELVEKVSRSDFAQIDNFEEDDTLCAGFIIQPLQCVNDTGQYGDVLVEWSRCSEVSEKVFRNICRLPISSLSIVSSPLGVDIRTENSTFKLCQTFTLEVELTNTTEIIMDVCFELADSSDIMISGERKSYVNLTPLDSEVFKYTCVPLKSGKVKLPAVKVGKDEGHQYITSAEKNILIIP